MSTAVQTKPRMDAAIGRWREALLAFALVSIWITYWLADTAAAMVKIWIRSETFNHCFLIPPISIWLIWRKRAELAAMVPQPSAWMLVPLLLAGFMWLIGELAAVIPLSQFAYVALIVLTVPALIGLRAANVIAFPLFFLVFAVPIGEFFVPYMMEMTADFTVAALRITGIPVYRTGLQFIVPSGAWSVVEACSGVRYLIASVTIGTLFAYLNYVSTRRRLLFVAVSILVPVVANWLRAYMIVMIGHLSNNKLAAGADHLIYGWVFFGVVISIMFAIGARWSEEPVEPGLQTRAAVAPGTARSAIWLMAAALALSGALPVVIKGWMSGSATEYAVKLTAPAQMGAWRLESQPLTPWRPAYPSPAAELRATYADGSRLVGVYVEYYRNQVGGKKLVSSDNALVKSEDRQWRVLDSGSRDISVSGQPLRIVSAELQSSNAGIGPADERLIVWRWYWINGRITSSDAWAKVLTAWSRLVANVDDSAAVLLVARGDSKADADAALQAFAQAGGSEIDSLLRAAKARP